MRKPATARKARMSPAKTTWHESCTDSQKVKIAMIDDPEGDEVECEVEPADWKVRVGPLNHPTERRHEASPIPFGNWLTHCMMGRGRTDHHTTKHRSEDRSIIPSIAVIN